MFTIDDVKQAHSKVKSGADFPAYVQDLVKMGMQSYDTYVHDGHSEYRGAEGYKVLSPARYAELYVADKSNDDLFIKLLREHQAGGSDYPTFCGHAAETGVEKWTMDLEAMTCTYYNKDGEVILVEQVPTP